MNIIFLSPNFPLHFHNFCSRLKNLGANVLAIGDCPYDALTQEVKNSVTEYYYVGSLEDYEAVLRATAYYISRYGRIDYVESQNEYWLETEARLREDFNVANGWRPKELERVKLKSKMKEGYRKAKIKTARFTRLDSLENAQEFAVKVGFPIIIKPDNGVGASDTYRIDAAEQLEQLFGSRRLHTDKSYIIEEFVPGHIETFDGITAPSGEVVFFTGQVMAVTPLDMLNGVGENISYTQPVERIADLREAGLRAVKAFGVKGRFFHFEFFRLDADKKGLGKKGDIIGLEVNMRAPGGYIPDKMNYAYDVDVYKIWAEALLLGENRSFPDYKFRRYATHFGRGAGVAYTFSSDEIRKIFSEKILIERIPPKSISGGMGAQVFILKADTPEELKKQSEIILQHDSDKR